jgi:thiol-disulfide isomerase/thioredoxin
MKARWARLEPTVSRKQQQHKKRAEREASRKAAERRRTVRNVFIGVGVVVLLGAGFFVFQPGPGATGTTTQSSWDLPSLYDSEQRVTLADFQGKPTVAAFFASWCPHCQRELPGFAALSTQIDDQVNFVAINTQDGGNGKGLAERSGIDAWPVARDIGGTNGNSLSTGAFGARGMPLTVIYGPDGEVADITRGAMSADQLFAKLQALFNV